MSKKWLSFISLAIAVMAALPCDRADAALGDVVAYGLNTINDRDVERILGDGDSLIEEDEILESLAVFDNMTNSAVGNQTLLSSLFGSNYELSAHVWLTVDTVIANGAVGDLNPNDGLATFVFSGGFGNGVAVRVYEDSGAGTTHVDFSDSAAVAVADGTDGNLILELGFEAGDYWVAAGPVDISTLGDPDPNDPLNPLGLSASFIFGLSVLSNPGNIGILDEGIFSAFSGTTHDVVGFGDAFAETTNHPDWEADTNTTVRFIGVPEPMSMLAWCGVFGAIGAAGAWRRRKSA